MTYKDNGNITAKHDAGTIYNYHATKVHAVSQIKNPSTTPLLPTRNQNISYNSLRKVCSISEASLNHSATFDYGLDDERIRMVYTYDNATPTTRKTTTTYYAGDTEIEIQHDGKTITRSYIDGPDGLIAIVKAETGGSSPPLGEGLGHSRQVENQQVPNI